MATINVLIAVDGAALASGVADNSISAGSAGNPTSLGAWSSSNVYISMIAPNSFVSNGTAGEGQGQSELQINVNSGDTVEWAITTFDNNFDQTPYLYNASFNPAAAISSPLSYASSQAKNFLGTGNPPSMAPTQFINQVNTASGTVQMVGTNIQYTLSFVLVNNSTGNIIGYFTWDPFIQS